MRKDQFEPWEEMRPIPLSPDDLAAWGTYARIAFQAMTRSKQQLVEMVGQMDDEVMDNLMTGIADATERFKSMVLVCDQAYLRLLVAASTHEVAKGHPDAN